MPNLIENFNLQKNYFIKQNLTEIDLVTSAFIMVNYTLLANILEKKNRRKYF